MVTSRTYEYTNMTQNHLDENKTHKEVSKSIDSDSASKLIDNETNTIAELNRKEIIGTTTDGGRIVTPNDNDILSGRGAGINLHPGNIFYRNLIQSYKVQYVHSDPGEKKCIIKCVFNQAKQYGRFLKLNPSTEEEWNIVPDDEARKKIGQALRENASTIKKQKVPETLNRKLDVQAPQLSSIADSIQPRFGLGLLSSLSSSPLLAQMNGCASVTSQPLSAPQPSSRSPISHLWYEVKLLQGKQQDLRQKQRELEDKQNQLMLQLYEQMAAVSTFNVPSSNESLSDCSDGDYSRTSSPNKRMKFIR